jgi:leukemia factor-related protein
MPNANSAFLGSNLWDKPSGNDGSAFDLEYMDLDEFLSENGIPVNLDENDEAEVSRQWI